MKILEQIIATKRQEIAQRKELFPTKLLEKSIYFESPTVSLSTYLKRPDKDGLIAEFKRKSPSKPSINPYASVSEVSLGYMQAGASALSILTDESYFGGKDGDLKTARKYNYCPILRKDFIVDPYQIMEARAIGADAILLISECLTSDEVKSLSRFAHSLGLEVLLECHSEEQLAKITDNIDVVGINNRNLKTFKTSIENSLELIDKLPSNLTKISESGIRDAEQAYQLHKAGYDGFLIGEQFMRTHDPAEACAEFIRTLKRLKQQ